MDNHHEADFCFPDQDQNVSDYEIRQAITNKKVFKQYTPEGELVSSDGWKLVEIKTIHNPGRPLAMERSTYQLTDPDGKTYGEPQSRCRNFETINGHIEVYYFLQRKNKQGKADYALRFGPAHFPIGTIFEVDPSVGHYEGSDHVPLEQRQVRFEVAGVHQTGARHWVVETTTMKPDLIEKGTLSPALYSIDHTARIIQRGKGVARPSFNTEDEWFERVPGNIQRHLAELLEKDVHPPKLKKGERLFLYSPEPAFNFAARELGLFNGNRQYNEHAMWRFLSTAGLGHVVTYTRDAQEVGDYVYAIFIVVKWKKLKDWVAKNYHRVLMTLDHTVKEEEKEAASYYQDMDL